MTRTHCEDYCTVIYDSVFRAEFDVDLADVLVDFMQDPSHEDISEFFRSFQEFHGSGLGSPNFCQGGMDFAYKYHF